ncbi:MAG TPA: hypothetical protein VEU30_02925, partial [Thermoanaerobaculia bacterium]|nr:hypothetical protein [Thermoanaerobaculia bacterium]
IERRLVAYDARLGFITLAGTLFAIFCLHLATGADVRWSANRAALIAAIVYALTIPAMLLTPIDGDEPFYLLVTESLVRDLDLDLANQYQNLWRSETGRRDLAPQLGDPVGDNGELYSRHEPFLPLLMVPGYFFAGLHGAILTIALFGVLLVRSTVRWMEDEGISDETARAVFPLFAFAPPILFYATRIWPEVPAAFCFVEVLRGMRNERGKRWIPALLGFVLLKLRFVLVAIGCLVVWLSGHRVRTRQPDNPTTRQLGVLAAIIGLPLLIAFLVTGSMTNVHTWRELVPTLTHASGFFGLLADGMSGIAFQAPFYLLGLFALTRWRTMPRGFRLGILASLLYLFYLLPRPEWFGGWAPPLRYIVFLMPVLALGAAAMWDRISRGAIAIIAVWTAGLVIHGLAYPWRLFHEATGENAIGEWLSRLHQSDFSRLFPSFIRPNNAAWIGAAAVILLIFALRRYAFDLTIPLVTIAIAVGFLFARQPGVRVEFEDAHVVRNGGALYPPVYTVMRVSLRGGWILEANEELSFLARDGQHTLHYITGLGAMIEVAGRAYQLPAGDDYATVRVQIPTSGRVSVRCLSGAVNLDRMDLDE